MSEQSKDSNNKNIEGQDLQNSADFVEDDPIKVRYNKRKSLIDSGCEAYAHKWDVDANLKLINEKYVDLDDSAETDDIYSVAGRIMAIRRQGKIAFIVLRDESDEIQIFCRQNLLGEQAYERVKELDVGDFIGVKGNVCRTKRGQLSIIPNEIKLLTKSLRPLPEKFHGLNDKETRYRQRYVDLIANPQVKQTFEARFKIVSAIRKKMEELGFVEVETPMLHPIAGGASARPFITHHNTLNREFYLRVAPELYLKRLLVGGFERVFEINRCFRNEGMDLQHNPEFTTLEAYQAYTDMYGMIDLAKQVIKAACLAANGSYQIEYQGVTIDFENGWSQKTMCELVSEKTDVDIDIDMDREELAGICKKYGIEVESRWGCGKMITELYDELVENTLIQPTFVTHFPLETSPLAKKNQDNENLTDRFELVICGNEYANAFSELNDPADQRERFIKQVEAKSAGDDEAMDYDEDYIRALEYGMPPAGGIGIGIDRLVMILTDSQSIRDVLLFPHMREESV